ncbi:hypothetical protein PspP139CL_23650 [Pseudomonas syringae]|nr:hypothetical protein [Pseudomonas syringae]
MRATLPENRAVMTLITLNRQRRNLKRTRSVRKGMRRGASHDSCSYRSLRSGMTPEGWTIISTLPERPAF